MQRKAILREGMSKSVSVNKYVKCARHSLTPDCEMSGRACTVYILINRDRL